MLIAILLFNIFNKLIHNPKKSENSFINEQKSMIYPKAILLRLSKGKIGEGNGRRSKKRGIDD